MLFGEMQAPGGHLAPIELTLCCWFDLGKRRLYSCLCYGVLSVLHPRILRAYLGQAPAGAPPFPCRPVPCSSCLLLLSPVPCSSCLLLLLSPAPHVPCSSCLLLLLSTLSCSSCQLSPAPPVPCPLLLTSPAPPVPCLLLLMSPAPPTPPAPPAPPAPPVSCSSCLPLLLHLFLLASPGGPAIVCARWDSEVREARHQIMASAR